MKQNGHERTDMDPKYILYFGAGLIIAGVFIHAGIWWMFHEFERQQAQRERQPVLVNVQKRTPEPHLQISPPEELQQLRRQEDQVLSTYGWVDRGNGFARIPIDRAMQLFIERQGK